MAAREHMPVHQLLTRWWAADEPPRGCQIHSMRLQLAQAIVAELQLKASQGIRYDPFADTRVLWAGQYLAHHENHSIPIDPDLRENASWHFDPPLAPSGKDRAAGIQ